MVEMKPATPAAELPSKSTYMSYLDTAVLDDQKLITYKGLSKELNVSVNNAKRMLFTFFDARKSGNPSLDATFSIGGYVTKNAIPVHTVAVVRGNALADAKAKMGSVSFVHVLSVQPKETKDLASMISNADSASSTIAERIENTRTRSQITCSTIKPRAGRKVEEPKVEKHTSTTSAQSAKQTTAKPEPSTTTTAKPAGLMAGKPKSSSSKSAKQSWAQQQMAAAMSRKSEDKAEKKSNARSKALKQLEATTAAMAAKKPPVKRKPKKSADSWIVPDGEESGSESDSDDEEAADRAAEGSDDEHDEDIQVVRKRPVARRAVVDDSSDEESEAEEVVKSKKPAKKPKIDSDAEVKSSQESTHRSKTESETETKPESEKDTAIPCITVDDDKPTADAEAVEKSAPADDVQESKDSQPVVSQGVSAEDVDTAELLDGLDDDMDDFMDDVVTKTETKKPAKKPQKRSADKEEFVPAPKGIEVPPGKKVIKITKMQGKRMITENVIVDDEDYVPPKRQKFNSPKKPQAKPAAKGKKAPKKGQASLMSFFKKS